MHFSCIHFCVCHVFVDLFFVHAFCFAFQYMIWTYILFWTFGWPEALSDEQESAFTSARRLEPAIAVLVFLIDVALI